MIIVRVTFNKIQLKNIAKNIQKKKKTGQMLGDYDCVQSFHLTFPLISQKP